MRSLPDMVAAAAERARSGCHLHGRRSRDAALRPPRPAAEGGVSQWAPRCEAVRRTRSGSGAWAHAEAAAGAARAAREAVSRAQSGTPRPSPGNGRSAGAARPLFLPYDRTAPVLQRAGSGGVRRGRGRAWPLGPGRGERNRRRPAWPGPAAAGSLDVSRRRAALPSPRGFRRRPRQPRCGRGRWPARSRSRFSGSCSGLCSRAGLKLSLSISSGVGRS